MDYRFRIVRTDVNASDIRHQKQVYLDRNGHTCSSGRPHAWRKSHNMVRDRSLAYTYDEAN